MAKITSGLLMLILSIASSCFGMASPSRPTVFVKNESRVPLSLSYSFKGHDIVHKIRPNTLIKIGHLEEIKEKYISRLTFLGVPEIRLTKVELTTQPLLISKNQLIDGFKSIPGQSTASNDLLITIKTRREKPYELYEVYSLLSRSELGKQVSTSVGAAEGDNVLRLFPHLSGLGNLTKDEILHTQSGADVLVDDPKNPLKMVDVFRGILGIENLEYSRKDVEKAYDSLSQKWESKLSKKEDPKEQRIATEALELIDAAHRGLTKALDERLSAPYANVEIYVQNNLKAVPLSLHYNSVSRTIAPGDVVRIGALGTLDSEALLTFLGEPTVGLTSISLPTQPLSVSKRALVHEYKKLSNQNSLLINISQRDNELNATYSSSLFEHQERENILSLFPELAFHELDKKISEEIILNVPLRNRLVYGNTVYSDVYPKDIYRYILELPEGPYTKEQVEQAFNRLTKRWNSYNAIPQDQDIARRGHKILEAAREGLLNIIGMSSSSKEEIVG